MLKQKTNSKRGFTIIEVVLVLAIAGLIFLMVFLALPALQRSQRDTQRRNELGELKTQVTQYQSNNRGRVPSSLADWNRVIDDYMNQSRTKGGGVEFADHNPEWTKDDISFVDPDGELYYIAKYFDLKDDNNSKENDFGEDAEVTVSDMELDEDSDLVYTTKLNWEENKHQIYAFRYARCNGDNVEYIKQDSDRLVAFVTKLEGSGVYCGEN